MTDAPSSKARTTVTTAFIQRTDGAALLAHDGVRWVLPVVETHGHWHAETAPVNAAIEQRYGVRATTLRVLWRTYDDASARRDMLIAMELRSDTAAAERTRWASIDEAQAVASAEHRDAIVAWRSGDARGGRTAWSHAGWLDATLAWCRERLAERGLRLSGEPEQSKHWSIASIWRLPTDRGDVWLKAVPEFFAHEGTVLQLIVPTMGEHLPRVIATDRERGLLLLYPLPGDDLRTLHDSWQRGEWSAANDRAVRALAALQRQWAPRVDELLVAGCVDRRLRTLDGALEAVLARDVVRERFTDDEVRRLRAFGETVPARIDALRACGVPETLMHGDFYPGNIASDSDHVVIFDWTDACVSHPFFDLATFLPRDPVEHAAVTQTMIEAWSATIDVASLERAAELAQPLACIHHATSYMRLLDGIDPDDHWEFDSDVLFWLRWLRAIIE